MTTPTIVASADTVPNAGQLEITFTIQQDGAAKDLTGLTVTATVRREDAQTTVIDASLEDHAVALVTAADGTCTLTLTDAEMQLLTVPPTVTQTYDYLIACKVSDGYHPQPYRLPVHGVLD